MLQRRAGITCSWNGFGYHTPHALCVEPSILKGVGVAPIELELDWEGTLRAPSLGKLWQQGEEAP